MACSFLDWGGGMVMKEYETDAKKLAEMIGRGLGQVEWAAFSLTA